MQNLLITYAPESPENKKLVEEIQASFDTGALRTTVKLAREATIVDIALADLVLFGTQKAGASDIPADYDELMRAFKGANLAGKAACVFSFGTEKPSPRLHKALRETDVSLLDEEPVFGDHASPLEVREWTRRAVAFLQEVVNARR